MSAQDRLRGLATARIVTALRDGGIPRKWVADLFGISPDTVTDMVARTRHCDPEYKPHVPLSE